MAIRVSVINFKGGVGKTTVCFHMACGLARFHGARVLLVDMDHQSSLSIVCVGEKTWGKQADKLQTVSGVFRSFLGEEMPGDEIIVNNAVRNSSHYKNVDIVPASLDLDDTEITLTGSHMGEATQSDWNKRTLLCRWIDEVGADDEYDYILFDCAPATKIVTQNALAASHGYVIPVVPEAVMERGAPHLRSMVSATIDRYLDKLSAFGEPKESFVSSTELVGVVVARIQGAGSYTGYINDHSVHLRALKNQWGDLLLKPYIRHLTGIPEAFSAGRPVYDEDSEKARRSSRQYRDLTNALKERMDQLF